MALRDKYDVLRTDHQTELDALNAPMEKVPQPTQDAGTADRNHDAGAVDREPTRPEGHYQQNSGWSGVGDMVSENAAARAMHKDNNERLNARDALNDYIDRAEAGTTPEKTPDITPAQPGTEQALENERSPVFRCFGEQDRSEVERGQEREGVGAGPSKEQGDAPTLTFMMDQDLDRGR